MSGFNSKVVRLKAEYVVDAVKGQFPFQFQSGAIKSYVGYAIIPAANLFQFQSGAIKSVLQGAFSVFLGGFQFQSGAIKSSDELFRSHDFELFQFQSGAIKSWGYGLQNKRFGIVSIPKWCD